MIGDLTGQLRHGQKKEVKKGAINVFLPPTVVLLLMIPCMHSHSFQHCTDNLWMYHWLIRGPTG